MAALTNAVVAAAAGLAGTKAMEQVASRLMALESEADQQREQAVGPGPPFVLAARNLAHRVLGVDPDEDQQSKAGMVLHYGEARLGAAVPAAAPPHRHGARRRRPGDRRVAVTAARRGHHPRHRRQRPEPPTPVRPPARLRSSRPPSKAAPSSICASSSTTWPRWWSSRP